MKLHRIIFYIFLFTIPLQTRILFHPGQAYISWYFNYHLGIFLYVTDIIAILFLTNWLIFDRPKIDDLKQSKLVWVGLSFILLSLITLFHVKHIDLGIYETFKWVEFLLIVTYLFFTFRVKHDFEVTGLVIFVSAVFQGLLGWVQFHVQHMLGLRILGEYIGTLGTAGVSNIETVAGKVIRAYGTMPHPNVLGAFLIFGLVMGFYYVSCVTLTHKTKIVASLGTILITIGLFTTFSRIAWIAGFIAAVSFTVYNLWNNKKAIIYMCLIAVVSCATIGILYSDSLKARVSDPNPASIEDRGDFNHQGIELVKQNPLLGVGVGNYVPAILDKYRLEPWQYQPAHNIYIFITAELGIVGLGLFLWLLFEIFSTMKNVSHETLPMSLILIGGLFLAMSMFDHYFVTIQQGRLMFAVVLGLIAALPNAYRNDQVSKINDQLSIKN